MEELERLTSRLENIQAVQPILGALRTISLGSRLHALNKGRSVQQYSERLLHILALITPHLRQRSPMQRQESQPMESLALLVIGSERGLCGVFNDTAVAHAERIQAKHVEAGTKVMLMTLGRRTERAFRRWERVPVWSKPLSLTALPPYSLAVELVSEWLQSYEQGTLDAVEVVYNVPRGIMHYEPTVVRLLPPVIPSAPAEEEWPPIIETDPLGLYTRVVELWLSARLYQMLLESAAAEHSARYQLLDGATQNAGRLIEELKLSLQIARQEAITAEMQDLASGAGLIGPRTA